MKYKLNKLELPTTNHFKVNDLEIELNLPKIDNLLEYSIISNEKIIVKTTIKTNNLNTKIGLSFPKYLETNIIIPKNTIIEEPIKITKSLQEKVFPNKLIITCEESSSADFIIEYLTSDDNKHWNYTNEQLVIKKDSKASLTYYNNINNKSINMIAYEGIIEENAKLVHNLIDISGETRIYNASIDAIGNKSKNFFNMIYLGKDTNKIDINYYFKNIGQKSLNHLTVEGSLSQNADKVFRGIIDFKKGSTNSIGEEQENCILLSNKCRSRSLPMLLCEEDSVSGSHGESSGKIGKDKLFYLMTRGLSKKEAEKFIIMANFQKIIKEIPSEELQKKIISQVLMKL